MPGQRWVYRGEPYPDPGIKPECYQSEFFYKEIELESEVFEEIRKLNRIQPTRICDSTEKELEEIWDFFEQWAESFYFLFDDEHRLIGSILVKRNYIQSLSVARQYQRMGFGRRLTQYAVNHILGKGFASVELDILPGNTAAQALYESLGFEEV